MSFYFTTGQQLPCGSTPISQSRVIGGQDAKPGAWPWQVRIIMQLAQQFIKHTSTVVSRIDSSLTRPYLTVRFFRRSIVPRSFSQRCQTIILQSKYHLVVSRRSLKVTDRISPTIVLKKASMSKLISRYVSRPCTILWYLGTSYMLLISFFYVNSVKNFEFGTLCIFLYFFFFFFLTDCTETQWTFYLWRIVD